MITINYEAYIPSGIGKHLVFIKATGTTPDEVQADMERQSKAIGAEEVRAVGLHNNVSDWAAMFGGDQVQEGYSFADWPLPARQEMARTRWWQFWK